MIMTMLLLLFGFGVVMILVIIVSPFTCIGEFLFSKDRRSGRVHLHWLHPWIAMFSYDIGKGTAELKIAGWTRTKTASREAGEEESGAPRGTSPDDPAVRLPSDDAVQKERSPVPSRSESAGRGPETETIRDDGGETRASETSGPGPSAAAAKPSAPPPAPQRPKRQRVARKRSSWRKLRQSFAIVRRQRRWYSKVLRWIVRTLRLCFHLIRFDRLRFHVAAGLDDPAETGKLYGWYSAVANGLFGWRKNVEIRFEPRFFNDDVECEGNIVFSSSIARVLTPLLVAVFTFPYLSSFLVWRKLRKVYKQAAPP